MGSRERIRQRAALCGAVVLVHGLRGVVDVGAHNEAERNPSEAAWALGMGRATLYEKLHRHGLA